MGDKIPMTLRGKLKLENELNRLIHQERPAVIKAIEEARSHGDLSENAEYDAAKEKQAMVEGRINEIQGRLAGAHVVDTATLKEEKVVFGAHVKLEDVETEEEVTYQIVGPEEADVEDGRISVLSPLARAMIGKKAGDPVIVRTPKSEKEYEILDFYFE